MKKLFTFFLCLSICFASTARAGIESDQKAYDEMMGISASDGMTAGVGISMMGWGIAIIVGITILALVLHQSTAGNTHSSSTSSSTGTASSGTSGLASTI